MQLSTDEHHRARAAMALAGALGALAPMAGPAGAHPHQVSVAHQGDGQVIANGQNHGHGVSCGGDPAAYGLETDGRQAATLGRRRRQLRDAGRVTGEVGRDQVREAAHRLERPIDRLPLQRQPRVRLA